MPCLAGPTCRPAGLPARPCLALPHTTTAGYPQHVSVKEHLNEVEGSGGKAHQMWKDGEALLSQSLNHQMFDKDALFYGALQEDCKMAAWLDPGNPTLQFQENKHFEMPATYTAAVVHPVSPSAPGPSRPCLLLQLR